MGFFATTRTAGRRRANGDRRVTFTYDYRGRRVKQVGETWSGSGWINELRLFVWDDWKMLLERRLAQVGQPPPTRAYTWGLDLAGQRASGRGGRTSSRSLLEGAGTIGGLLAVADGAGGAGTLSYVYCYDANGNVGQVVDPAAANVTASLVATYEYDPYGGVSASAGAYAATNPEAGMVGARRGVSVRSCLRGWLTWEGGGSGPPEHQGGQHAQCRPRR
jgi:hypothetical protein